MAEKFTEKLKNGEIKPDELAAMSSKSRRAFFSDFLGEENAKKVNALFESKLLLKNQQQGIINWAKKVAGKSPELMNDILSKVQRMEKVLQPKQLEAFLGDLAEQRLGIGVSADEAGKIVDLSRMVADAKGKMDPKTFKFPSEADRMEYGRAKEAFGSYVADLKIQSEKMGLKDYIKDPIKGIVKAAGAAKSIKATLDNSALFRQGMKTLWAHPTIWGKNAVQSFIDIAHTIGGKEVMKEVNADLVSRPNALNGLYAKEKLAIGNVEEAFPSHFPEKIPGLGRLFKASEAAYTAFLFRTRADVFDKYIEIAQKSNADTEGIGRVVNSLTGRGNLGKLEPVANVINNVFFSPRFVKSQVDFLTGHQFDKKVGKFAKRQAAINLVKMITGTAAILAIAKALGAKIELDSRSTDPGKIIIGGTRFDVTGGAGAIVTLASRLITLKTKNSAGVVTDLNSGEFGSQTGLDLVENFFENKLSPAASVVRDLLKGQDFNGKKPTVEGALLNMFAPLPITNTIDTLNNPEAANPLLVSIADGLGLSASTPKTKATLLDTGNAQQKEVYMEISRLSKLAQKPSLPNFDNPTGKLKELRQQIGEQKFEEAKKAFTDLYTSKFLEFMKKDDYKGLSADLKKARFDALATAATQKIERQFGYKPTKKTHTQDTLE